MKKTPAVHPYIIAIDLFESEWANPKTPAIIPKKIYPTVPIVLTMEYFEEFP